MENNDKGLNDNYIFGAYFGSVSFFIVSMPEKNLSGGCIFLASFGLL